MGWGWSHKDAPVAASRACSTTTAVLGWDRTRTWRRKGGGVRGLEIGIVCLACSGAERPAAPAAPFLPQAPNEKPPKGCHTTMRARMHARRMWCVDWTGGVAAQRRFAGRSTRAKEEKRPAPPTPSPAHFPSLPACWETRCRSASRSTQWRPRCRVQQRRCYHPQ